LLINNNNARTHPCVHAGSYLVCTWCYIGWSMEFTVVPIYIFAVYSAYSLNLAVMLQNLSKTLTFYGRASLGSIL
jgi:hypothetical protein